MDEAGKVRYVITADAEEFIRKLRQADSSFSDFAKGVEKGAEKIEEELSNNVSDGATNAIQSFKRLESSALSSLAHIAKSVGSISFDALKTSAAAATSSFIAMSKQGISDTQFLENTQIQLQGLTHSVEDGAKAMAIAANYFKNNPFDRFSVTQATKDLIQFGATLDEVPSLLDKMGKVSLSTGVNIAELANIYQKASSDGRVGLMDIEILAGRGVPIWDAFAKATGKSAAQIRELTASGGVAVEDFQKAFDYLVDDNAMEQFENTFSRQVDRVKGRLSNLRASIAGYTLTPEGGLIVNENGLYRSVVRLYKAFADLFNTGGPGTRLYTTFEKLGNAVAPWIDKLSNALPAVFDKVAGAVEFLADNTELLLPLLATAGMFFGNILSTLPGIGGVVGSVTSKFGFLFDTFKAASGPIKLLTVLLGAGIFGALKDPAGQAALKSIISSLMSIVKVLAPVVEQLGKLAVTVGTPIIVASLTALSKVLEAVAWGLERIPTPVLTTLTTALIGLAAAGKVTPIITKLSGALGIFSKVPVSPLAKVGETVGSVLGKTLTSTLKAVAQALPYAAQAAAVVALVGAAIGGFIALVGGGMWVFGEGLNAVGRGFTSLSQGLEDLASAKVDGLGDKISALASALSGLFWKAGDFGVAALTFSGIGKGLQELGIGLKELDNASISSIEKKLPALAKALKEFQIGGIENIFGGNVLSKFRNLGDAITSIAQLINVISEIKINDQKLQETMSALANGLKAFLIAELRPGFLTKVFVGDIKTSAVTDYLSSLGSIIEPLNKLFELTQRYNFDSNAFAESLQKLGECLKAFLITELKPSIINKFFIGDINVKSVTDYLGSLGSIIEPLNNLFSLMSRDNFDSEQFTKFLSSLGDALKAFLTNDITEISAGFTGFNLTKNQVKGILEYFDNFGSVVDALIKMNEMYSGKNFDSEGFTSFVKNIGESLQAFFIDDSFSLNASIFGGSIIKNQKKSIIEGLNNLREIAEILTNLGKSIKSNEFDPEKLSNFVKSIGEALQATVFDSYSFGAGGGGLGGGLIAGGWGVDSTVRDSILNHLKDFKSFAEGISTLLQIPDIGKNSAPEKIASMMNTLFGALKETVFETSSSKTEGVFAIVAGGFSNEKKQYDSIFNHLKYFKDFADSLKPLLEIQDIGNGKAVVSIKSLISTLSQVLTLTTFKTSEESSSAGGNAELGFLSAKSNASFESSKAQYDSIFNHLGDFKSFTESLKPLLEIKELGNDKVESIKNFIKELTEVMNTTVFMVSSESEDGDSSVKNGQGNSNTNKTKQEYDSIFNHLSDFQSFTNSLRPLLEIKELGQEKVDTIKNFIKELADVMKETVQPFSRESNEEASAAGVSVKENAKVEYDSIFNHLEHFQSFTNGVKTLLDATPQMSDESIERIGNLVFKIMQALKISTFNTSEEQKSEANAIITGASSESKTTTDTMLSYMSGFETFANSIVTLATLIGNKDFDDVKFTSTIRKIFSSLKVLALEEKNYVKETNSFLNSSTETGGTSYNMAILEHIGEIQTLANALNTFINTIGIGKTEGLGENFSTQFTGIIGGIKKISDLSEIDFGSISVDTLNQFADFLAKIKPIMLDWDTSTLPEKSSNIRTFITDVLASFQDTEKFSIANETFTTFLQTIKTTVELFGEQILEAGKNLAAKFNEGIVLFGIEPFAQSTENILQAIIQKISDKTQDAYNKGYEFVGSIKKGMEEYPIDNIKTVGENIALGLIAGMDNKLSDVRTKADELGKSATEAIALAAQVRSPSRVAIGIGEYIGEGLSIGLLSQTTEVANAAEQLVDVIQEPFGELAKMSLKLTGEGGDGFGVEGNVNNSVTINYAAGENVSPSQMGRDILWAMGRY